MASETSPAATCPSCERPWSEHTKGLPGFVPICPPRPASAATVYRGWTYIVHQVSRFAWDVEIGSSPGDGLFSYFTVSPFRAMTAKGAEVKFRRWLDKDIAWRQQRVERDREFARIFGHEYRPLPGDVPEPEEVA